MTNFIRCIRSDCYKFKHTSMLWIHILIPLILSCLFLAYYSVSPWNSTSKISAFLEAIGVGFPLIIGLISSKAVEQEGQAGSFQGMLCTIKSRALVYTSKLILLILMGTFSVILAIGVFACGFKTVSFGVYLKAAGILTAGSIFIYILHLFISLQYGRGASIGLGIGESLIAALALTGLGDGRWYYIPCTWGARLCDYLVYVLENPSTTAIANREIEKGLLIVLFASCVAFGASVIWFRKWEGRKSYD